MITLPYFIVFYWMGFPQILQPRYSFASLRVEYKSITNSSNELRSNDLMYFLTSAFEIRNFYNLIWPMMVNSGALISSCHSPHDFR